MKQKKEYILTKQGKQLWNDGWEFLLTEIGADPETIMDKKADGKKEIWRPVEVPHDWLIYDTKNMYQTGEGWYRKCFFVPEEELEYSHELLFDGVYMNTTVYVNGKEAGAWKYGYTSFSFEISPFLQPGENRVWVRVQHEAPNTRWYSGAGIYRNVYLICQSQTHLITDGIYIVPRLTDGTWRVHAFVEYQGEADQLRYSLIDDSGSCLEVRNGAQEMMFEVEKPYLWSLEEPRMYRLMVELLQENEAVDACTVPFGLREIEFSPEKGFSLNGIPMKFQGVCMHHDLGALGSAFNVRALRRQLEIMKEMGVNAIRTSHNPPAPELAALCDEMGFLMMSEIFDMWELSKNENDYSRFFHEWYQKDVASWIRRDRNHPSLVMWSIGNEILDTHTSERGLEVAKLLKTEVRKHDPLKNAPVTIASNYMQGENAPRVADELKFAGYNYAERLYDRDHEEHPDWFIYGSETASTVRSRGVYHFPIEEPILVHEDLQCSELGNSKPAWAGYGEQALVMDRDRTYCGGQFIWTGFDYIGEPTPYQTKNSYFGAVDTAGFPKSGFYLYREMWKKDAAPFVKLFPHWDWNEGQLVDVISFSNVPEVELFLNGNSLGTRKVDLQKDTVLHAHWKVPFEKGELLIQAYDETHHVIAQDRKVTFSDGVKIQLSADEGSLLADGRDLKFITITVTDEEDNLVENATNRVRIRVEGAARLVGLDNGDSADYDSYKGDSRRLFNGMLLAIVQTTFESGRVRIVAESEGLESAVLEFEVMACPRPEGISVVEEAENIRAGFCDEEQQCAMELPVRKIELTAERTHLDADNPQTKAFAHFYPVQADHCRVQWRCVAADGNEVNFASVTTTEDGNAIVRARGDGTCYLRACCKNGRDYTQLVSDLPLTCSGLGEATVSAYRFQPAKGSDEGEKEYGIVIQRGGVMVTNAAVFDYPRVDFGDKGSDCLIFEGGNPYPQGVPVTLYAGAADAEISDCEKVAEFLFEGNGMYDNYAPQQIKLEQRITGTKSLHFAMERLIFGGFSFRDERAFLKHFASEHAAIYGDAYTCEKDCVTGIGNNVIMEFEAMDFGSEGANEIVICGKTENPVNTIQMRCTDESGDSMVQLLEFTKSDDWQEQRFMLEPVCGKQRISFVFLPGCQFDFGWFVFEKKGE